MSYSSSTSRYQPSYGSRQQPQDTMLNQAQRWLGGFGMGGLLRGLGRMSTTQKIVGGVLLVAGARYLTRKSTPAASAPDQEAAGTLHELLYFVNDRIEGYKRAVEESQDPEQKGYYKQLVSQSQQFASKLNGYLRRQNGEQEVGTTLKGKLYRGWMDAKALITDRDEAAILDSNIYGEEWALKAYQDALDDHTLTGEMRQEVERQHQASQKTYRELQKRKQKA